MGNRSVTYELVVDLTDKKWGISCPLQQELIGPVQYGWDRFKKDPNSMTFGGGLLAGSPLAGTRRMIFCGYSPAWEGFYVSALGGAMFVFHRFGVNFVWLRGQCNRDTVLVLKLEQGNYTVSFDPVEPEKYWEGYKDKTGIVREGFYGLQYALFEKYQDHFLKDPFRILTVGPAARLTKEGAIGSSQIRKGEVSNIDDWAGRGGLGSRLLQYHRITGIVFGGDWQDPALKEARELDKYFLEHFGQRAVLSDLALSQKYRYVPEFNTGGTFGVNMHEGEDRLFSFNYSSIYASSKDRLEQHQEFITKHYLKQFNEEIIEPRKFDHCGEPCAVACKKFVGVYRKDYEPYQVFGPNCGIFDQRAAEKINKYVDTMGWDAIQAGGMTAWIMELLHRDIVSPSSLGLKGQPKFDFVKNLDQFDVVADSAHNADVALSILDMILFSSQGEPFRKGIRYAAKWLDANYNTHTIDFAVYNAHGELGCMVPNQYWVPGMFAPMPIMGKYFSFYGREYLPPYELGKKNVERFVYELYSENSGSCRFHRKWVEDIIDDIILSHFELCFDYWKTNFDLAKEINDYQSAGSVFWESGRVVDIIYEYLQSWKDLGLGDPSLESWMERFKVNRTEAARDYWQAMYAGMQDSFLKPFPEPEK
jgi:glyceraldehyde-3-phosphate dehydrogenase (ferredoxin)